jgi:peptidoglycan/xylan/chitin deacetylase (PgdA/CDA1 family)
MAIPAPVYRVNTTDNKVYLTFDDGPYVDYDTTNPNAPDPPPPGWKQRADATTDALLNKLHDLRGIYDAQLTATFFINGWTFVEPNWNLAPDPASSVCQDRRAAAIRILREGHDLANHSQHHYSPWGTVDQLGSGTPTVRGMLQEINECRKALRLLKPVGLEPLGDNPVGEVRPYFRSPGDPSYWPVTPREKQNAGGIAAQRLYGNPKAAIEKRIRFRKVLTAAQLTNLHYVSYNIWGRDDSLEPPVPANSVYLNVKNRRELNRHSTDNLSFDLLPLAERRGGIILMHNGRASSVNALTDIVKHIYDQGFQVRKLPEALP